MLNVAISSILAIWYPILVMSINSAMFVIGPKMFALLADKFCYPGQNIIK